MNAIGNPKTCDPPQIKDTAVHSITELNMKFKLTKGNEIQGDLDIFIAHDDESSASDEILIHGNPEGLKSFAKLLLELAELNQENVEDKHLPVGTREHYHLRPDIELSQSSNHVTVGRLDAKGTGNYYDRFLPKTTE